MGEQKEESSAEKNCASCKKPINRAKRYYREGAYYCNKNCYKKKIAGTIVEVSEEEAKGEGKGKDEGKKDAKAEGKGQAKNEPKEESKAEKKEEKAEEKKSE